MLNLLDNAVKFTSKGSVTLKARSQPEAGADASLVRLYITVSDTGPGIAPQDMHMLFTRFGQIGRHAGLTGTGLGLPITQQLARKMGGDAYVTSTLGRGSDFTVEIAVPLVQSPPPQRTGATQLPLGRVRADEAARPVLVADGDADGRQAVCTILRQLGFQSVVEAATGEEAIEAARRARPAVVLMDQTLPDMDGAEAARRLRAMAGSDRLPIIATSASPLPATPSEADAPAPFGDWVAKPVQSSQLQLALTLHGDFHFTGVEQAAERHVSRRVLVVDDHPLNQRVVSAALERAGHQVVLCGSGEEAVQRVLADTFDVVLMDLRMPGMDGLEASRRVRAVTEGGRRPHIVLMSASVADDDFVRCLEEAGVNGMLPKPFRISDLLSVVNGAPPTAG